MAGGIALSEAQKRDWLQLIRTETVGPATFRALLNRFGSARAALEALPDLARRGGARLPVRIPSLADIDREWTAVSDFGARLVALGESDYPAMLAGIDGPPPLLAVRGAPAVLRRTMVAVVGARNASLSGRKMAGWIADEVGRAGPAIVSGLARGIDAAAHQAALPHGTVAVMAGGLDRLYPPENRDLMEAIVAQGGALVTEMPMGWDPRARDFPRRNRLVSGLSIAVVLVEAAAQSGSLHTARFALEQGREVLAVPGSPLDPRCEGCNRLIRDGATLISHPRDVIEAIGALGSREPQLRLFETPGSADLGADPSDFERRAVVEALGPDPVAVDELARDVGLTPAALQLILLELDLAGRLERHRGGRVSLVLPTR